MKSKIAEYKKSMIDVFLVKYKCSEIQARKWIKEYEFDRMLKMCNYIALHDDPENWVDEIYDWASNEQECLEM